MVLSVKTENIEQVVNLIKIAISTVLKKWSGQN